MPASFRTLTGLPIAVHDGVQLQADAWLPESADPEAPARAMLLLHGGAFTKGSRASQRAWGEFLAANGIAAISPDYRLARPGRTTYPGAIHDARAALQFVRASAADLHVDPARIGVMGGSAGAYLAAMLALTARVPAFANPYPDPFADQPGGVDVVVAVAGNFDMLARWHYDRVHRPPEESTTEAFIGGTPYSNREAYYEASPIYHASTEKAAGTKWLIAYGTRDDISPPEDHSIKLAEALKVAGALVRLVPVEGAPHFWHMEGEVNAANPYSELLGKRLLTFLHDWARW